MFTRSFITVAILTNTIVGHLCTMPVAMAAEMPAHHGMDATEQMMTPMAPISHADCPHCPHHEEKKEASQSSPCAGHCLSQATANTQATIVVGSAQLLAVLPLTISIQRNAMEDTLQQPSINPSPPHTSTDFVVLRL